MKFIIIENNPDKASFYDHLGIDYVLVDLEILGKVDRQGHLDTVISSHHNISDVRKVKARLSRSKLIVRCNPIHKNIEFEINKIIDEGADLIMLPYFKSHKEVEIFLSIVNNRVETILLLETPQALCRVDKILELRGVNKIHIGLNDLHLGMGLSFMFELLSNDFLDPLIIKLKERNIDFGIGGVAGLESGHVNGALVMNEYIRLGSQMVILSRSFFSKLEGDFQKITEEVQKLRNYCNCLSDNSRRSFFVDSHQKFKLKVDEIVENKLL
jgi:hypothetical protein